MTFSTVSIIYNPKSTGDGEKNARALHDELRKSFPKIKIKLEKTKYAGHAEKLAYDLACGSKNPLIISSSGDGGYNEVINGAIKAQSKGAHPICAVLASGNANDHSRAVHSKSLGELIKRRKTNRIDLLKITIKAGKKSVERYAHSYIGLGLTPEAAVELNSTDLSRFKEIGIVIKAFIKYRPFEIRRNDTIHKLDSLIFANIGEMAKVLTISKKSKPDDGQFEVAVFKHDHKLKLLLKLVKAGTGALDAEAHTEPYGFTVNKSMPIQLDGEIISIEKGSVVEVALEPSILQTIM